PGGVFSAGIKGDGRLGGTASGEQRRFANLLLTVAPVV
ncbi:RbsD/FucU transporter, partial [Serratia marcescens]|nr:RbsD/FucU transporter [Serratia marcescens]